ADQVRSHHQSDDRKGAWPDNFGIIPPPRRRGDRMSAKMKRRAFITLLGGAAAWPLAARAQQGGKVYRIGFAANDPTILITGAGGALVEGWRENGFVEGKNIVIERRFAEGRSDRAVALIAELVRDNIDLLVTSGAQIHPAAKQATTKIPIVMVNAT